MVIGDEILKADTRGEFMCHLMCHQQYLLFEDVTRKEGKEKVETLMID